MSGQNCKMNRTCLLRHSLRLFFVTIIGGLSLALAGTTECPAQSTSLSAAVEPRTEASGAANDPELPSTPGEPGASRRSPIFRVERISTANGAELLTIFGKINQDNSDTADVPLVSIARDTFGDSDPENDRLRYIWMLTYSRPTLKQKLAAAIPFFYHRVGSRQAAPNGPPPALLNIPAMQRNAWSGVFWFGLQHFALDTQGLTVKLASRTYRRNLSDYHTAHVVQALSILSMYDRTRSRNIDPDGTLAALRLEQNPASQHFSFDNRTESIEGAPPAETITPADSLETQARLILSGRLLGPLVPSDRYRDVVDKRTIGSANLVGHNWELLRQRAENEGLYFEPLRMPDGTITHAILWVAKKDLTSVHDEKFDGRFLNIANPWKDRTLRTWEGYSETRYFDSEDRQTIESLSDARTVELIPLAVYGLDNPRIPTLLVDFRDGLNPKKREVSRRIVNEVASNIMSLSFFDTTYYLGRKAFEWITNRRGMDINQPTRLGSYSQLKLLLSMNSTIAPTLRNEIERRLEAVSPDPLTNDRASEIRLARQQYSTLIDYARRPDGLAAKIERERQAEMVPLKHGKTARLFFRFGTLLTFGRYVHRETETPELLLKMETARRADHHLRYLREATNSTPQIEVTANLNAVKRSLQFVVDHSIELGDSAAKVSAQVFTRTADYETRRLCIEALSGIKARSARNELLRIYRDPQTNAYWRTTVATSLRKAVADDPKLTPAKAKAVLSQIGGN